MAVIIVNPQSKQNTHEDAGIEQDKVNDDKMSLCCV